MLILFLLLVAQVTKKIKRKMQFASVNWFTFTRDSSKKGEIDYGYDAVE